MKQSNLNLLFVTLVAIFLTFASGCMDEGPQDVTKEIEMLVSNETGITYHWGDDKREFPIECMMIKEKGWDSWSPLCFGRIEGFEYEKGHAYRLKVARTILANPPADDSDRRYKLIRVISDIADE